MKRLLHSLEITCFVLVYFSSSMAWADEPPTKLEFRIAETEPKKGLTKIAVPGNKEPIYLYKEVIATEKHIATAKVDEANDDYPRLLITLTKEGKKKLERATDEHIGKTMAILLNGKVLLAAVIHSKVSGDFAIVGAFTKEELERIVSSLRVKPSK